MSIMPLSDYKRIMTTLFITIAAGVILSLGSVLANHYNTKFQVQATKQAFEAHVKEIKEKDLASEDYVNTVYFNAKAMGEQKETELKRRVSVVEDKQDQIIKLLHEIKGRLPK